MMTQIDSKWVCLLCKERALADPHSAKRPTMRTWAPDVHKWKIILAVVGITGSLAFRIFLWDKTFGSRAGDEARPETWVTKAHEDWPLMVTKATAVFENDSLEAAPNGFFVQSPSGAVLGVTMATNSWVDDADADEPDAGAAKFSKAISDWKFEGGGKSSTLSKLLRTTNKAFLEGVVVFQTAGDSSPPVAPRKVRTAMYSAGMKIYVVASDGRGGQTVYPGRVLNNESADGLVIEETLKTRYSTTHYERGDGSASILQLEGKIPAAGLLGGMVLDARGYAAGIVTGADDERKGGTLVCAFGAEAFLEALNPGPNGKKSAPRKESQRPKKPLPQA